VQAHFTGSLDAVADILGREGMKPYGGLQIDSAIMKGQVDALLNVNLKLSKKSAKPDDTLVRVNATIANLTIEKLIGKEKLEQGQLTVVSDAVTLPDTLPDTVVDLVTLPVTLGDTLEDTDTEVATVPLTLGETVDVTDSAPLPSFLA
jgi:hypothetical protein